MWAECCQHLIRFGPTNIILTYNLAQPSQARATCALLRAKRARLDTGGNLTVAYVDAAKPPGLRQKQGCCRNRCKVPGTPTPTPTPAKASRGPRTSVSMSHRREPGLGKSAGLAYCGGPSCYTWFYCNPVTGPFRRLPGCHRSEGIGVQTDACVWPKKPPVSTIRKSKMFGVWTNSGWSSNMCWATKHVNGYRPAIPPYPYHQRPPNAERSHNDTMRAQTCTRWESRSVDVR